MTGHTPECTDCGCDETCTAPLPPCCKRQWRDGFTRGWLTGCSQTADLVNRRRRRPGMFRRFVRFVRSVSPWVKV